jgi:hypothetical protein
MILLIEYYAAGRGSTQFKDSMAYFWKSASVCELLEEGCNNSGFSSSVSSLQ